MKIMHIKKIIHSTVDRAFLKMLINQTPCSSIFLKCCALVELSSLETLSKMYLLAFKYCQKIN